MKLSNFRKGFTLVEIMIVVVIIGILATLAVPALKKARNSAVEKSLFNDARQISQAANSYFADKGKTTCTLSELVGGNSYISSLSSGTLISQGKATANLAEADLWSNKGTTSALGTTLCSFNDATNGTTYSMVSLGNMGYDAGLSANLQITTATQGNYASGDNFLVFSVDSGALLKKAATGYGDTAAYTN